MPHDRRRPGRIADVNPALVELLRGNHSAPQAPELTGPDNPDQLSAMRGVAAGAAMVTAPLFMVILTLWLWR